MKVLVQSFCPGFLPVTWGLLVKNLLKDFLIIQKKELTFHLVKSETQRNSLNFWWAGIDTVAPHSWAAQTSALMHSRLTSAQGISGGGQQATPNQMCDQPQRGPRWARSSHLEMFTLEADLTHVLEWWGCRTALSYQCSSRVKLCSCFRETLIAWTALCILCNWASYMKCTRIFMQ